MKFSIGQAFAELIEWLQNNFEPLFDAITTTVGTTTQGLEAVLMYLPDSLMVLLLALLAWAVASRGVALFTLIGMGLLAEIEFTLMGTQLTIGMGYWAETMATLSLIMTASLLSLLIGIPLGIWAAKSETVDAVVRPILDFMQTMPPFVYLIPAVVLFGLGTVPGVVATFIFATPPCVRLTNLGIRQVSEEAVEAAQSFGSTPSQLLFKVELPMALPTILAGVNQTVLLALSMVVVAALIGSRGLGQPVVEGLTQLQIGKGFEGGLGIVILAIFLDRITQAVGEQAGGTAEAGQPA
jgi:glycine betaine/proline transport system permease protein